MNSIKQSFFLYRYAWLGLLISVIFILAIGQWTDIDLIIEDYYYDEVSKTFPWRRTWFSEDLMHGYVKRAIVWTGYLFIFIVIADLILKLRKFNAFLRIRVRFVALASLIVPAIIRGFKHYSTLHCPWDIDRYGGSAPFLRFLDKLPNGIEIGKCFPAGHATVGLWLAALCVFWLPHRPKTALSIFFAGISVGFTLGWVQQMRGAHFLFHTLWAAWLASLIILLMIQCSHKLLLSEK